MRMAGNPCKSSEQGRVITAKLAAADPSIAQWQRDLSVSLTAWGHCC